jgi:methylenetetrahydrofolate dehydrogenase (NADP+) / methenyltetrahydrofolate cyclohydrolase
MMSSGIGENDKDSLFLLNLVDCGAANLNNNDNNNNSSRQRKVIRTFPAWCCCCRRRRRRRVNSNNTIFFLSRWFFFLVVSLRFVDVVNGAFVARSSTSTMQSKGNFQIRNKASSHPPNFMMSIPRRDIPSRSNMELPIKMTQNAAEKVNQVDASSDNAILEERLDTINDKNNSKLIDGKAIAATIRQELKERVTAMKETGVLSSPGLAVLLVGSRRDSQTYVNMKKRACQQVGIRSFGYDYADEESVTQDELLQQIDTLNADPTIHGILIQLPLPAHIDEATVLRAVDPEKDVDGLHPFNVAQLASQGTHNSKNSQNKKNYWDKGQLDQIPFSVPCTPLGCMELLDRSGVEIAGRHAVVIGRSNLVGMPLSFLLLHRHATVTIVHSKTQNIEEEVRRGDIVIAAVGKAQLVQANWIKEGAVVIDVGINSIPVPPDDADDEEDIKGDTARKSYQLVGDVDLGSVLPKCSKITPVPGGVGPMTIAMLLRNTINACERSQRGK